MINKDKLNTAFRQMRNAGLVARQNFTCCGSCAGYELTTNISAMPSKKRAKGVCFYHRQDAWWLNLGGDLYLSFGPVDSAEHGQIGLETVQIGRLVVRCLELAGLAYEWDGTASQRILVRSNA
jgi:hypothetical protein